ncbi:MAG: serine/threonine protein kinase [Spirochaetaceae bacterium]|jgi:Ser/Thr protein kinase RdoA (MazF antagonist)|nr:serine/threonine protein kinase [Spirochaetaceae bacterium]
MESFYKLTPHAVLDAVEEAGFDPMGVCSPMNSLENRVYRISLEEDKAIVAKFYRPGRWNRDQIEEEHSFLQELLSEDVPVAAPLKLKDGKTLVQREDIFYALWNLRGGRQRDEFSPEDLLSLGRIIGRIHSVPGTFKYRPAINTQRYIDEPLEYFKKHQLIDPAIGQRYIQAANKIAKLYNQRIEDHPMVRLHGDCHVGNILYRDNSPLLLDFDDCLTGPPVQDLWMIAGSNDHWGRQNRALLAEGYMTFADFNFSWWNIAELLRGLRLVYYVGWLARRRDDPAFERFFSNFGTRAFWEQETLELELLIQNFEDEELKKNHFYKKSTLLIY